MDIPNSVNSIGNYAFTSCTSLTSINIPNSVTSIGSSAFTSCASLISVNFEGTRAEWDAISIGANNDAIGNATINCAGGIASGTCGKDFTWTLGNDGSLTISGTGDMENYTGSNAPWNTYKSQITSLKISDGITSIGKYAFSGCSRLTSINIPNSINNIGEYAFYQCANITSLTLGNSLSKVGDNAFTGCSSLKSIYSPFRTPIEITEKVFQSFDYSQCKLYVPAGSKKTYASAIGWKKFTNIIEIPNDVNVESVKINMQINGTLRDATNNTIKRCVGGDGLTLIANVLPANADNKTITWSSSNTSVATINADGTVNIIRIGETTITATTTDGTDISASCTLTVEKAISLKDTDIKLDKGNKLQLTATISEGLSDKNIIWTSSNENVAKVSSTGEVVAVGGGYATITAEAANNETASCTVKVISYECGANLTWSISADGTLTISGSGDMDNYYSSSNVPWTDYRNNITKIVIGDRVTSIGNNAFNDCTNVKSVKIGSSVTKIGNAAFHCCENLSEIIIPNSVVSIGDEAFYHCENATSLTLGNSLSKVGDSAFEGCYKLTSVVIPESLTTIPYGMFSNCESLNYIKFPNTLTSIGKYAFEYCESLESLYLPSSLNSIGYEAFYNCKNLFDVHCAAEKISNTDNNAFEGTPISQCVLYVPENSVLYYSLREPWKYFGAILAEDFSTNINSTVSTDESNEVHTLNGVKLNIKNANDIKSLPKGIYIINGKKVMVK